MSLSQSDLESIARAGRHDRACACTKQEKRYKRAQQILKEKAHFGSTVVAAPAVVAISGAQVKAALDSDEGLAALTKFVDDFVAAAAQHLTIPINWFD